MTHWHFFDKVYRVWVVFTISSPKEFEEFLTGMSYRNAEEFITDTVSGMCVEVNTEEANCFVVWLRKWDLSTLVHELTHLSMMALDNRGVELSHNNTEAMAFYMEFWFNEITRAKRRLPNGRTPAQARRVI